jgi:hypothetical protein
LRCTLPLWVWVGVVEELAEVGDGLFDEGVPGDVGSFGGEGVVLLIAERAAGKWIDDYVRDRSSPREQDTEEQRPERAQAGERAERREAGTGPGPSV